MASSGLKRPTDQVGKSFLFLFIIYTYILWWTSFYPIIFIVMIVVVVIMIINMIIIIKQDEASRLRPTRRVGAPGEGLGVGGGGEILEICLI